MSDQILFAVTALDKPESKDLRQKTRTDHLKFIDKHSDKIVFAGPFVDELNESIGSLYVVGVPSEDDVRAFIQSDPYSVAGLFETVEIRRWRLVIDNIHG